MDYTKKNICEFDSGSELTRAGHLDTCEFDEYDTFKYGFLFFKRNGE